jgi:hypothetical protein
MARRGQKNFNSRPPTQSPRKRKQKLNEQKNIRQRVADETYSYPHMKRSND